MFVSCLGIGFWKASHKPLWTDEFYSQVSSIHNLSFTDQFLGKIPEGANTPLFYAVQKLFLQLICYRTPSSWVEGHWTDDGPSRMVLRVNPVVFMSLSAALVFYYFYRNYSIFTAFYSFFIFLSSYMWWTYCAEARPYALIVLLTTIQSILFLKMTEKGGNFEALWRRLALVHLLMAMTFIFSIGPVLVVSLLLCRRTGRDIKKHFCLTILPIAAALFYYTQAPKYHFFFGGLSPEQLVRDNISRDRFDILFIFLGLLLIYGVGKKVWNIKKGISEEILSPLRYIALMGLTLAFTALVLSLFAMHSTPGQGFPITSRYFIYLLPIGVITTTILTVSILKSLSPIRPAQYVMLGLIGFLVLQHYQKTVPNQLKIIGWPKEGHPHGARSVLFNARTTWGNLRTGPDVSTTC